MKEERKEGIILRTIDYKDNSKILYIYTKEGLVSVLARGVKKLNNPFKSSVLTYNLISFTTTNTKMQVLTDCSVIDYLDDIKTDYSKALKISRMSEIVLMVMEPSKLLYDFFISSIKNILNYEDIMYIFYVKMTYFFGVNPQLKCHCGNDILYFDIDEGVGYCVNHTNKNNINLVNLVKNTYMLKYGEKYFLDSNEKDILTSFIKKYYHKHIDSYIKIDL